jgi:hypothetical protein
MRKHPARAAVPAGSSGDSWGGGSFPVPGEQLVEPRGGVVGDAAQQVGEPGLRIDVVEFCRADQRVDRRGTLAAIGAAYSHALRPIAIPRSARRQRCWSGQMRPSSRKRVKAVQRLSM